MRISAVHRYVYVTAAVARTVAEVQHPPVGGGGGGGGIIRFRPCGYYSTLQLILCEQNSTRTHNNAFLTLTNMCWVTHPTCAESHILPVLSHRDYLC